jgi:hypothetical protein
MITKEPQLKSQATDLTMHTIQLGKTVLCSGRKEMFIPGGEAHARQCYIRIPFIFTDWPVITISIFSSSKDNLQNISIGSAFVPLAVENAGGSAGETLIKVSAINANDTTPVYGQYICNYVVVGEQAV